MVRWLDRPLENITVPTPTSIKENPKSSVLIRLIGKRVGKSTAKIEAHVIMMILALVYLTARNLISTRESWLSCWIEKEGVGLGVVRKLMSMRLDLGWQK
jgi:hypothetical protein